MKRIITLLLALVMAATAVPMISVAAAEDERLTLNVGESLALDEISGSTAIAAEANGNKYMQVQKMDYNGGEGIKLTINPLTVDGTTYKYYYIRFKVRNTNEEYDGLVPEDRYLRLSTSGGTNATIGAYAYQITTNAKHFTKTWQSSGFTKQANVIGDGGWTGGYGNPIYMALTNTANPGAVTLNINAGAKVSEDYSYVYANLAAYEADSERDSRGRWRTDHDTAIPFEIDDIEIGYFIDDRTPESVYDNRVTSNFAANFTEAKGFRIYTTIDFEDGTLSGKDANGNIAATVSANNATSTISAFSDIDGMLSLAVNTENDYLRVLDMTAADSGKVTFDKPLDTGIYTLSGDFRLLYYQNSGQRLKVGNTTASFHDKGIHEATITVTDTNGNNLGSFVINPWWDKDEITFALKEPADGIKLTMTQNGITEANNTLYENTVDVMNLKLTLGESFSKELPVAGGLLPGLKMYSTDSTRIVTDDRNNTYLHIGERNYMKGNDGVFLNTGVKLEALTEYTIAVKARQSVGCIGTDLVAINVMPLSGTTHISGYRDLNDLTAAVTWTRTHKDMPYPSAVNYDSYHGHVKHSGYGYAVVPGDWETYLFSYIPSEDINSFNMSIHTSYASGAPVDLSRWYTGATLSNGTLQSINKVNPIDIDDIVIYKSASATPGTEIYEWDFENGMPTAASSAFAQTANATANTLTLESGDYYSIIGENGGIPQMTISGFDGFENGKYSISFDVRIGAYDGDIDKDHNTANITLKSFRESKADPTAELIEGSVTKQTISAEWTTITYEFNVKSTSELEKLVIGFEALGEGYLADLNRIDYRNFSMTQIPTEISDIPYNGILMLMLRKRFNEKGDGNYLSGALTEENLQYWTKHDQTLEVKTAGEGEEQITYLAASDIKNNYSGYIYENGKTLTPGTYLLRVDLRTSTPGEDTQLRISLGDSTKKIRFGNEWVTFESVFDIEEETALWLRFRGGPLAFYRQSFDIANLTLINLDELERGQTVVVGGNLFPTGDFEDPTATYKWNGGANETQGWGPIQATRTTDSEGNGYILVSDRAVNHQNLDLDTGIRVEKGRVYTINYRIRTADHRSDSGMRVSATAGSSWYKLKVEGEGADDYASSWYNSYAINGRWKEVSSQYVAESDGTLKLRFSGDTSAKSIHDLEIDDIEVYLVFKGTK